MWRRRLISIPLLSLLTALLWGALPLWIAISLLIDLVRPRRMAATRTLLFFGIYLACECAGVAAAGALWLWPMDRAAFLAQNYRLQWWWNSALFQAGLRCYAMRVEERWDSPEAGLAARPVLVFIRHTSTADTVLPVSVFSCRHGVRLRFVLKEELRWDPCLDIVGGRLPNAFVRRGGDAAANLTRVRGLADGLGQGDGVLIYPEGTRFTPGKRARLLERLSGAERERAAELQHLLPAHPGGPAALLEAVGPDADVWFCGHTGYEAAGSFTELINGRLIGQTVRMRFWKVSASEIPSDAEGRRAWLHGQWREMDRWVGDQPQSPIPRIHRSTAS